MNTASTAPRLLAYLQLVRLPAVFTAAADVMMGYFFVHSIERPQPELVLGLLLATSLALYMAGMALNDYFDREADARERPWRPIPSGRVTARTAGAWGAGMIVTGVIAGLCAAAAAGSVNTAITAAALALAVLAYDAVLKQTPVGPLAMGTCRALNVLLGMSVATADWSGAHWVTAAGIGTYFAGITWFARREAGRSSTWELIGALIVLEAGIALLAWLPQWTALPRVNPSGWRLLMLLLGLQIGYRCVQAVFDPSPARVQMAVKHAIQSVIVLDAAVCFAVRDLMLPAMAILLLLAPAVTLGRWIYST